mmetsp:Transcript_13310/g.31690  ORF Transcript_13310/g.31690 Transcript_13310/m.31690 type:complete len:218 (+) Transcript_13310:134-787(+)
MPAKRRIAVGEKRCPKRFARDVRCCEGKSLAPALDSTSLPADRTSANRSQGMNSTRPAYCCSSGPYARSEITLAPVLSSGANRSASAGDSICSAPHHLCILRKVECEKSSRAISASVHIDETCSSLERPTRCSSCAKHVLRRKKPVFQLPRWVVLEGRMPKNTARRSRATCEVTFRPIAPGGTYLIAARCLSAAVGAETLSKYRSTKERQVCKLNSE